MIPATKCGLSDAVQSELMQVFSQNPGIHRVILFGSRAKGNFKPGSDIDLVMNAPELGLQDLLTIQGKIDDLLLPYKVDIILNHMIDDDALRDHIKRVGIVFYHRPKA